MAESDLPDFDEEFERRLMKHFAGEPHCRVMLLVFQSLTSIYTRRRRTEIERNRQRSEKNLRAYSARDKMQEAEELAKMAKFTEFDKNWSEDNR